MMHWLGYNIFANIHCELLELLRDKIVKELKICDLGWWNLCSFRVLLVKRSMHLKALFPHPASRILCKSAAMVKLCVNEFSTLILLLLT